MIDLINTICTILPIKNKHPAYEDVYFSSIKFGFRIFGNLKKCKSVLFISHGVGGNKDASYVVSLANRFSKDETVAVVTFDSPGVGSNKGTQSFWGVSAHGEDLNLYYDEMIDYIRSINSSCKIYLSGFSGGAGTILSYLTCSQGIVPNKNRGEVTHSFLVSVQSLEYLPQLSWIRENSGLLSKSISISHGIAGIKFYFGKKNLKKIKKILSRITDIKLTIKNTSNSGSWYKHNLNVSQDLNATVIISPDDPITRWSEDNNIIIKHRNYNLVKFPGGGHCGFYKLDGTRAHEELIYKFIKKDQGF